jgi:hypothetical protein
LVGELLLELLVRGSNPSGVELLLESVVRGWSPTCPIRVHLRVDAGKHTASKVCISFVCQKPSVPHGTGHLGLCLTSSIGESPIATTYPANYWQKAAYGGKTAQVTGRADKAWPVAHADLVCL